MITLLKTLPAIAVLVIGLLGGSAVTSAVSWGWLTIIHDPAIKREATATLTVEVRRAADAAQVAEHSLQQQAQADATRDFIEQKAKDDEENAATVASLQQEIDQYEAEKHRDPRPDPGSADCSISQHDLDFIVGVRHN